LNAAAPNVRISRKRDARLDLARGLTMLIIFVAHVPANVWADFIPARMGFSSGAEAFVLCSGLACGVAFGGVFRRDGWMAGTRRILRRVAQLWVAQLVAFAGFAIVLLLVDHALGGHLYRQRYGLDFFASQPVAALVSAATLTYVPAFFDILPLYIVLLAAIPLVAPLARRAPSLVLAMSAALWLTVQIWPLNLPSHPFTQAVWYFDPFAWQFLFFIGFGVTAGWWQAPSPTPRLLALGAAFIAACVPLTFWGAHEMWPALGSLYRQIYPSEAITTLHPLRLIHALALAWVFAALLASRKHVLQAGVLKPLVIVGQQSLTTFLTGIFLSALAGVALDLAGRDAFTVTFVNLAGMCALVGASYAARAIKAAPSSVRTTREALS
jgi:hypothetical protein